MNLSKRSEDKELLSLVYTKDITMNLSKRSEDKELFSGTLVKENTNNMEQPSRYLFILSNIL